MKSVVLIAGHSNVRGKDNGAVYDGRLEGVLAVELRRSIFQEYNKLIGNNVKLVKQLVTDPDNTTTAETVRLLSNISDKGRFIWGKDWILENPMLIDLHFNAAQNPSATGTEVIVDHDANQTEIQFATAMAKTISETLKIKNRGVKSEILSHRGRLGILHITNNSILIEVCFISNKRDIESLQQNHTLLSTNIAKLILDYIVS